MKIYLNQLEPQLKKGLTPTYLISGEVLALIEEAQNSIESAAKKNGFSEALHYHADSEFDWEYFKNSLSHYALFQEKQCITLQLPNYQITKEIAQSIEEFADTSLAHQILVLIGPKLDAKAQKYAWIKKIIAKGVHIPIWPMDFRRYQQWIQNQLDKKGLTYDFRAIQLLSEQTEGNYTAAKQAVEKLVLAHPKGRIGVEEVALIGSPSGQYTHFDWIDTCLSGDQARVIHMAESLRKTTLEPTIVLWSLTQALRQLAHLNFAQNQNLNLSQTFKEQGIWEKKQIHFQKALQRHDSDRINALLEKAFTADQVLKGAQIGNAWDYLIGIGAQLSQ